MDFRGRSLPKIKPYNLDGNYAATAPGSLEATRPLHPEAVPARGTFPPDQTTSQPAQPSSISTLSNKHLPFRFKPNNADDHTRSAIGKVQRIWWGAWQAFDPLNPPWVTKSYHIALILCLAFYVLLLYWPLHFVRSPSVRTILDGAESELSIQLTPFSQSLQVASGYLAAWPALHDEVARIQGLCNRVEAYGSQQRDLMNRYRQLYTVTMPKARSSGDCRRIVRDLLEINTTTGLLRSQHTSMNLTLKGVVGDFRVRSNAAYDSNEAWYNAIYEGYVSIRDTKTTFHVEPYTSSQQTILSIIEHLTMHCALNTTKYFVAWSPEQKQNKQIINDLLPRLDDNVKRLLGRQ